MSLTEKQYKLKLAGYPNKRIWDYLSKRYNAQEAVFGVCAGADDLWACRGCVRQLLRRRPKNTVKHERKR